MILSMLALLVLLFLLLPEFFLVIFKFLPALLVAAFFIAMGTLTWVINNAKGRDGGFWWGFFLLGIGVLVVALRPEIPVAAPARGDDLPSYLENPGAWYCPNCGRSHAVYERSCVCGTTKEEVREGFDFTGFQPVAEAVES